MNLKQLAEPFTANEIEWRIGQAGQNAKGIWAKVLAYITNRAIMERLDAVCGPENWRNEFRYEQGGAILCGISIRVPVSENSAVHEWVTKWDGAEATDIEAVKGGLSNAMKRAAVQWGIGRYLYDLEEGWADVTENGQHYAPMKPDTGTKKGYPAFRWNPPKLPAWALPTSDETVSGQRQAAPPTLRPVAAIDHIVKGKRLGDYDGPELNAMQKALRAEGASKHKPLLADITTVLNDRLLGPSQRTKSAPWPASQPTPLSDEQRGERVKAMSGAPDDLPF